MKTERGTVLAETDIYKGVKAKLPVLRTVLDTLSVVSVVTFIVCNDYIPADVNVLILLDVVLGIFGILVLLCLAKSIQNYMNLKNFYAETRYKKIENVYEFFANGVGMYQRRGGKIIDCEILYYSSIVKKWETKTHISFMRTQCMSWYPVEKNGLEEEELNAIRAALGLPFTGKKTELPDAELSIAPFVANVTKELSPEPPEQSSPTSDNPLENECSVTKTIS